MVFSEIIGHKDLVENLKRMVSENHLPHALLFSEQSGCGALTLVLALTQFLFCKTRRAVEQGDNTWELRGLFGEDEGQIPHDDSCQVCSSCIKVRNLQHPDLYYIFPINTTQAVEKGKKVSIDAYYDIFRKLVTANPYFSEQDLYKEMGLENKLGLIGVSEANWIIDKLSFTAFEGGSRVVIVLFPERMNAEAANKLLKSIEEPSEQTYFFMITNAPGKIIKTIRSRCRLVEVPPIEQDVLSREIAARFKLPEKEAVMWAKCSQGSMGRAIELINESADEKENFEEILSLFNAAKEKDLPGLLEIAASLAGKGKEEQKQFCISALKVLREAYILKINSGQISYASPSHASGIKELSQWLSPDFYQKGYDIFNNAVEHIERNVNTKILFTDLCNQIFLHT